MKKSKTKIKPGRPPCPTPLGMCPINNQGQCCYYCAGKEKCSLGVCHRLPSKCGLWWNRGKKL